MVYLYSSSLTFVCLNQNRILMSCRNVIKGKQTKVKTVMHDFDNKKSMSQISTKAQYTLNLHVQTEIYIVNSFENCFLSRKRETSNNILGNQARYRFIKLGTSTQIDQRLTLENPKQFVVHEIESN